ncbi:glycoprotein membrane precursor GPI-anchored [Striga asiatica]|uniref:Glycoprotein membrane GPI-anchored n=1 Tax=Striga asiatica TaxID=4170 RepID=A0A5A7NXR2_STRAF|nr:glycoprotein membrane precursor GPI-anchored [Striga asiatica]
MTSLSMLLLLSLLFQAVLIVKCDDDDEDRLVRAINQYRTSLNLTALNHNEGAECLASELADEFRGQPCTNTTTGSNMIPGVESQFPNFPRLLTECHLSANTTRDGQILHACVPGLDPALVLSNFTSSQYAVYLNGTQFTGIGAGSEDNWIVVVLTTNTSTGDYTPGTNVGNTVPGTNVGNRAPGSDVDNGALGLGGPGYLVVLILGLFMLL